MAETLEPLDQRVVVYNVRSTVKVYATVYTDEQAARAVKECTEKYPRGAARTYWAKDVEKSG